MIYNRTSDDVKKAKEIIEKKVKKFESLSEEDIKILEKGTFTIGTIKRINDKKLEISKRISEMGYHNFDIKYKEYSNSDIFDEKDFESLIEGIRSLADSFFVFSYTPKVPSAVYHFLNLNDAEKILSDLEKMITSVIDNYRECGGFYCGGL